MKNPVDKPLKTRNTLVRFAREEDCDALILLAKENHADSAFSAIKFSEKKANASLDRSLKNRSFCTCIVVEIRGDIIGYVYGTIGEYFIGEEELIASVQTIYTM